MVRRTTRAKGEDKEGSHDCEMIEADAKLAAFVEELDVEGEHRPLFVWTEKGERSKAGLRVQAGLSAIANVLNSK